MQAVQQRMEVRRYKRCTTQGCTKEVGTLKCPTCVKMELPEAYFCSQECFKAFWPFHKDQHVKPAEGEFALPPIFNGYKFTGSLRPTQLAPTLEVPAHIKKPDYWKTSLPLGERSSERQPIRVYSKQDIEMMRVTCRLGREVLDIAGAAVRPGITTDEIDKIVHEETLKRDCYPSPLNYRGFPKSCCTSINE